MGTILKATIGLRVSDDEQAEGLDNVLWELPDEYELHGRPGTRPPKKEAAAKRCPIGGGPRARPI
jgi:hypothetical protein